jgi:hypothetical protein
MKKSCVIILRHLDPKRAGFVHKVQRHSGNGRIRVLTCRELDPALRFENEHEANRFLGVPRIEQYLEAQGFWVGEIIEVFDAAEEIAS